MTSSKVTVVGSDQQGEALKHPTLKVLSPVVILMTISGAPIKDLSPRKVCCWIQWLYSFLVFCCCIVCIPRQMPRQHTEGIITGYDVDTWILFTSRASLFIFQLCQIRIGFNLLEICSKFDEVMGMNTENISCIASQQIVVTFG